MASNEFDKIMDGLADASAYAQGDTSRGKAPEVEVPAVEVRAARKKIRLSQEECRKPRDRLSIASPLQDSGGGRKLMLCPRVFLVPQRFQIRVTRTELGVVSSHSNGLAIMKQTRNELLKVVFSGIQALSIVIVVTMWGADKYLQEKGRVSERVQFSYPFINQILSSNYENVFKESIVQGEEIYGIAEKKMNDNKSSYQNIWWAYAKSIRENLAQNNNFFSPQTEKVLDYLNLISHCATNHCDKKIIIDAFGSDMSSYYNYYRPYLYIIGSYKNFVYFFCQMHGIDP